MKHVVCLSQVFYPDSQSTSQLLTALLTEIGKLDCQVTVISGFPAIIAGKTRRMDLFVPPREEHSRLTILRTGLKGVNFKRNLWCRGTHYMAFIIGASAHLMRRRRADAIFAVTNPPFTPVWLWLLSRLGGFDYQLMLHDIYPDGLAAIGRLRKNSVVYRLWAWANRLALRAAEKVIVLGRDMQEHVHSEYGVPTDRIVYIPHWSVVEGARPALAEGTELWAKLDFRKAFVVQYSGNMGLWHDINSLVRAAARLEQRSDIKFLFIGDGLRRTAAKALADSLRLTNITWLSFQPADRLHDSLSCCHLAIISQRRMTEGVAVPCKLYGILAAGRGVLAMVPSASEVAQVVREEKCGVVIDPEDDMALASVIEQLAASRETALEMGARAYSAWSDKYTLADGVKRFRTLWQLSYTSGGGPD